MAENKDILVSGAGVAGPVLAYWLRRYGFDPTVVERTTGIRKAGGHAVDLWGSAVEIVERTGIFPEVETARTKNDSSSLIRPGKPPVEMDVGELAARFSDRAVEIPRDELTRLLYETTSSDVDYIFGDSIAALEQDADGVQVAFRHSAPRRFDLVIGADGLHSGVRRLAFGEESRFRRYLGGYIAVCTVPNLLGLDGRILNYREVDRTVVLYPIRQSGDAGAVFMFRRDEEFDYDYRDVEEQKRLLRGVYATSGWEVPRLLAYLEDTDAFYFDSISQIRTDAFSRGRVALVGDAGYAPGAGVSGGTSLAATAAYILARELATAGGDHGLPQLRAGDPRHRRAEPQYRSGIDQDAHTLFESRDPARDAGGASVAPLAEAPEAVRFTAPARSLTGASRHRFSTAGGIRTEKAGRRRNQNERTSSIRHAPRWRVPVAAHPRRHRTRDQIRARRGGGGP